MSISTTKGRRSWRPATTSIYFVLLLVSACGGGGGGSVDTATASDASGGEAAADGTARRATAEALRVGPPRPGSAASAGRAAMPVGQYNVLLRSPSVAERFGEDTERVRALAASQGEGRTAAQAETLRAQRLAYHQQLETEQADFAARAEAAGAKVVQRSRAAINMVTIEATAEQVAQLRASSGVVEVQPVRMLQRQVPAWGQLPTRVATIGTTCVYDPANPVVQALNARQSSKAELLNYHDINGAHAANIRGIGITVAVLDDGIDYTHVAFGGPGTAAMLNRAMVYSFANDDSRQASAMFPYPGSKILGGYDFIDNDRIPFPGFERRDPAVPGSCTEIEGHGTNVLDIVQTVAPEARFHVYRVCGAEGCPNSAIIAALNRSLDPYNDGSLRRVDIATLSLGSAAGRLDEFTVRTANNVARAGVIVTAAAGNNGAVAHGISSPAVAPKGTAVAEVQGPQRKLRNGDPADLAIMEYTSSSGPGTDGMTIKPEVGAIGQVLSAKAGTGNDLTFFGGTSGATPVVAGVYALLKQRYPSLSPLQLRARLVNTSRPGVVWGGRGQTESVLQTNQGNTDWGLPANTVRAANATNAQGLPFMVSARTPVPAMRLGGGEVRANAALRSPVLFYAQDDARDARTPDDATPSLPASVNFGKFVVSQGTQVAAKTLVLENLGGTTRTFTVTPRFSVPAKQASGAVTVVAPSSVTVAAGGRTTFTVSLRADPSKLAASNQFRTGTSLTGYSSVIDTQPWRAYRDECNPTDPVCQWLDTFDGKLEIADATETLRLPWHAMPLLGSDLVASKSGTTASPVVTVRNQGTAATGTAEFFDWLGQHEPDAARAAAGKLHILAWGAREIEFNISAAERDGGLAAHTGSLLRRGLQVVYVLDRTSLFQGGVTESTDINNSVVSWLRSQLKLGIDVDGDGQCGNRMFREVPFRLPAAGENIYDWYSAYQDAQLLAWFDRSSVNTTRDASDAVVTMSMTTMTRSPGEIRGEALNEPPPAWNGMSQPTKQFSQVLRGRHLEWWGGTGGFQALGYPNAGNFDNGNMPEIINGNLRNVGGVSVDFASGLVVSFIVPIDDSARWYSNVSGTPNGPGSQPFTRKPGTPQEFNFNDGFGVQRLDFRNVVEGLRLNPGQTTLTLCPMIGDKDIVNPVNRVYPAKQFNLGQPRYFVQGTTKASATVSVAPGQAVTRSVTPVATAHPALGLMVRSWRDQREVNLITLP